ncbi:hypothetical protein E5P75_05670 [Helicobacter pylori]|nr:hypothetical protein E5P75_05670 [Helicobacter pylori]
MEKTETTIFVDWQNLLHDLIAIQKNPKTDSILALLISISTAPNNS